MTLKPSLDGLRLETRTRASVDADGERLRSLQRALAIEQLEPIVERFLAASRKSVLEGALGGQPVLARLAELSSGASGEFATAAAEVAALVAADATPTREQVDEEVTLTRDALVVYWADLVAAAWQEWGETRGLSLDRLRALPCCPPEHETAWRDILTEAMESLVRAAAIDQSAIDGLLGMMAKGLCELARGGALELADGLQATIHDGDWVVTLDPARAPRLADLPSRVPEKSDVVARRHVSDGAGESALAQPARRPRKRAHE